MLCLFNNPEATESMFSLLGDKEAECCKDMAEDFFRQQNYDLAIYSIAAARLKNPQLPGLNNYLNAYMVHKVESVMKNWYAVLGIKDHGVGVDEIRKRYKGMAVMVHPDKCSSVAAEGATKIINEAWEVLSDSRRREAYDRAQNPSSSKRSRNPNTPEPSSKRSRRH